jgi:hypothetical protein
MISRLSAIDSELMAQSYYFFRVAFQIRAVVWQSHYRNLSKANNLGLALVDASKAKTYSESQSLRANGFRHPQE